VERWAATWAPDDDALLGYECEAEALTLARVWLALGRHADALDLLGRLRPPAEAAGRVASVIEMLIVQALAWHARGDEAAALASLGQALARAEPCGFVRLFVDEGAPLAGLLEALAAGQRRGTIAGPAASPGYLRRLLVAFGGRAQETSTSPAAAAAAVGRTWPLVEPLSAREREVLRLMATGAANQQIADRLVVAITTVKTHVNGIFRKLDATSRIEAVARARDIGVLER
jgi:LuxR family maltose regulon positive regulatory protein